MWGIILRIAAPLLIKYGMAFVLKRFPNLPKELREILESLSGDLAVAVSKEDKKSANKKAARKAKEVFTAKVPEIKRGG